MTLGPSAKGLFTPEVTAGELRGGEGQDGCGPEGQTVAEPWLPWHSSSGAELPFSIPSGQIHLSIRQGY